MIRIDNLVKRVPTSEGELVILKGISLQIEAAETVAIVGASGSGKSTLLGLMAGLDTGSTGDVSLDGHSLAALDEEQRAMLRGQLVGFVFQSFQLLPSLTALENVMLPIELKNDSRARDKATALLGRVGLGERCHHYPNQLSGGEQQRVAIARAIAKRPQILLCDEPTGALDARTGRLVLGVLEQVNRETGTSTAIITHNAAIGAIGDAVVRMSSGEIVERVRNPSRMAVEHIEW